MESMGSIGAEVAADFPDFNVDEECLTMDAIPPRAGGWRE